MYRASTLVTLKFGDSVTNMLIYILECKKSDKKRQHRTYFFDRFILKILFWEHLGGPFLACFSPLFSYNWQGCQQVDDTSKGCNYRLLFWKNYSFAILFSWRKSLNNSINPHPQALLLQTTSSDDIIEISIRISKAKVLRVYSLWKKRVARSLVFSLCLVVPNCIHIESPSFTYTKNETHIYHNVIPHTDR